jgi:hypothetical protein
MPLGQKDEMSQNTCDMEHNHLNTITPRLGIPDTPTDLDAKIKPVSYSK